MRILQRGFLAVSTFSSSRGRAGGRTPLLPIPRHAGRVSASTGVEPGWARHRTLAMLECSCYVPQRSSRLFDIVHHPIDPRPRDLSATASGFPENRVQPPPPVALSSHLPREAGREHAPACASRPLRISRLRPPFDRPGRSIRGAKIFFVSGLSVKIVTIRNSWRPG